MRNDILRRYGVDPAAVLGSGMEATVYARDESTVLKLYHRPNVLPELETLQRFYDVLDASALSYELPRILSIENHGEVVVTVERRLAGVPVVQRLSHVVRSDLDDLIERYLAATLELPQVRLRAPLGRHKLFDPDGFSAVGDWHAYLSRYLDHASARLAPFFRRDVDDWERKRQQLQDRLRTRYTEPMSLIHGDIFPGNVMIEDARVTALIDFGMMTMVGDSLWDVATAAVFFDMYDELGVNARDRCLDAVRDLLGSGVLPTLYTYVLLYSVVAADAYAPPGTDGHYRWCVDNLNNDDWWSAF